MGSKVCGLCTKYKVNKFKDEFGGKWDMCELSGKSVKSLQEACEAYTEGEPINLPEWFMEMIKKHPKYETVWDKRVSWWRPTKAYEKADKKWWKEYFVKKEEAEKKAKEAREATGSAEGTTGTKI